MNETKEFARLCQALAEVVEQRERALEATDDRECASFAWTISHRRRCSHLLRRAVVACSIRWLGLVGARHRGVALILPLLAFTDRIVFDGLSLRRQGPISSLLTSC